MILYDITLYGIVPQLLDAKIAQLTEGDGDGDGWNEKVSF